MASMIQMGRVVLCMGCSHITTNLGSHRAQIWVLCIDVGLLLYAYKAYKVIISTSQLYLYVQLLNLCMCFFTSAAEVTYVTYQQ